MIGYFILGLCTASFFLIGSYRLWTWVKAIEKDEPLWKEKYDRGEYCGSAPLWYRTDDEQLGIWEDELHRFRDDERRMKVTEELSKKRMKEQYGNIV